MKFELRPFQIDGVKAIWKFRGRAILGDDQGLGKTVQMLEWIRRIPGRRPAVIVCPSSVKYNWQQEAWDKFRIRARVLEGRGPKAVKKLHDDLIILNYDILPYWLETFSLRPPQIVGFDEAHFLANPRSRRSRAAKIMADNAASAIALTGTPLTNEAIQLWSILNIVKPELFPDMRTYAWRYTRPRHTHWGWLFKGSKNEKELHKILVKNVMIRRLKEDVAKELPPKIHRMIPVRLTDKALKEYNRANATFLTWLREWSPARANRAKRSEQLAKVGYLMRLCARLRLPHTCEFIRDFHEEAPKEQLVGLSAHTFVLQHLEKEFPDCVVVDGKHTGKVRHRSIRRFQQKRAKDFWGNWIAAGAGLNLQNSHNFLSLDPPWTPGTRSQGTDRVHRIGQDKQVIIHHMFAIGTIEEKWMKVLDERGGRIARIIDGKDVGEDGGHSILDEVLAKMKKR